MEEKRKNGISIIKFKMLININSVLLSGIFILPKANDMKEFYESPKWINGPMVLYHFHTFFFY